jgi:hypothetical protein
VTCVTSTSSCWTGSGRGSRCGTTARTTGWPDPTGRAARWDGVVPTQVDGSWKVADTRAVVRRVEAIHPWRHGHTDGSPWPLEAMHDRIRAGP